MQPEGSSEQSCLPQLQITAALAAFGRTIFTVYVGKTQENVTDF
jgi:hypothetical protein